MHAGDLRARNQRMAAAPPGMGPAAPRMDGRDGWLRTGAAAPRQAAPQVPQGFGQPLPTGHWAPQPERVLLAGVACPCERR